MYNILQTFNFFIILYTPNEKLFVLTQIILKLIKHNNIIYYYVVFFLKNVVLKR